MAFGRKIELTIIPQNGGLSTIIKDLHMAFNVEKTLAESSNKGNIKVWNLSETTRSKIRAKDRVILKAGYEDEGTANLFFGDIQLVTNEKDSVDHITEIEAYDGQNTLQNRYVSLTFGAGTPIQVVFNTIIANIGIPLANATIVLPGQYAGGFAFAGAAKDALTEVLKKSDRTWSIQNEQIAIHKENEVLYRTGLIISPETGLIGSPQVIEDTDNKQGETETVLKRWNVQSLLFPQLVPGALIQLKTNIVNGFFKIETVTYDGDNFEGNFVCDMDVVEVL